jgi:hypothetical protein
MVAPVLTILIRCHWNTSNLQAVIRKESSLVALVLVGMGVCLAAILGRTLFGI